MDIPNILEHLASRGVPVTPHEKGQFQINEEMATMLLTVLMSEVDALRFQVQGLQAEVDVLKGGDSG
jgi:hypothetical protein